MTWPDLDDVAQNVMIIASEEGVIWEACASWVPEPGHRGTAEIERTRSSVAQLVQLGLVRMYRLSAGNPDLTDVEVVSVMNDQRRWVYDQGGSHDVALYLTDLGETVYRGAAAEKPTS
ncbi:hypothetical protein GCM10009835_28510 [Planosporangium flavigriseum]|uniref:Uncharacterized protein n=1 Tax=Planosporangium flavigriseum TaxID=373681 RepID=A0A8J3PNM6_9ACTN|nr:hypothetical protein Pfl04_45610 [Planosporangium flavigriseum]